MLSDEIVNCTQCSLHKLMPTGCRPVPGFGPLNAKIAIVGESLNYDGSILEQPLVGQAGQLLDKILKESGLVRSELYLTNVVKCRPTDNGQKNRKASKEEIKSCKDWLFKELFLIKPKVIVPMGIIATNTILNLKNTTMELVVGCQGKFQFGVGGQQALVFPSYHPSFLIQNGKDKYDLTVKIFNTIKKYV